MPPPELTRAQQRRMRELADAIDRIAHGDLNYFAQFPRRRHRVREADSAEIEQAELIGGGITLSPGNQHYRRAVRSLTANACISVPVGGPADAPVFP
jgi:hypothetical protein